MKDRYEATIDRVSSINARIVSRFQKIKNGQIASTTAATAAQQNIDLARAKIDDAKKTIMALKAQIEEINKTATSTKNTKSRLLELKKKTQKAELEMKKASVEMQKALDRLKEFEISAKLRKENATTTTR